MKEQTYKDSLDLLKVIMHYVEAAGNPKKVFIRHSKEGIISLLDSDGEEINDIIGAFFDYIPCYLQMIANIAEKYGICEKTSDLTQTDDYMQIQLTFKEG